MADATGAAAAADAGAGGDALDALDAALAGDEGAEAAGEEEWTPPTREEYQAQQTAHQAALEAEQGKLKRAREQAKRLREGGKPSGAAPAGQAPADGGPGADVAIWQSRAVRAAAKAELLNRGADSDMVDLAVARLKPTEIEFNEDDEPELDEWLDDMQARYPKLFAAPAAAAPAQPRRPGRVDQGASAGGQPVRPQMKLGEKIVANSEAARRAGGGRARIGG